MILMEKGISIYMICSRTRSRIQISRLPGEDSREEGTLRGVSNYQLAIIN
jgi:hypothetical protein